MMITSRFAEMEFSRSDQTKGAEMEMALVFPTARNAVNVCRGKALTYHTVTSRPGTLPICDRHL